MGGKANKWGAIAAFGSAAVLTALLAMLCASPFAWPIAVLAVALFASSRWLGSAAARLAGIGDAAMPAACVAALREGREDEALQALSAAPAGSVLHPLAELSALRTAALAVARQALHAECAAHAASRAALAPLQARQDDDAGRLGKAVEQAETLSGSLRESVTFSDQAGAVAREAAGKVDAVEAAVVDTRRTPQELVE